MFRKLGPNLKILLIPLLVIAVVAFLAIYLFKVGYAKVNKQISDYKENTVILANLKNKLSIIKESKDTVLPNTDMTLVALPAKNPVVLVFSQIKTISKEKEIDVREISFSIEKGEKDVNSVTTKISVSADTLDSLLSFLTEISKIAPVSVLKSANLRSFQGEFSLGLELISYWSLLPTSIPAITQPIVDLTQGEKELLEKILILKTPSFVVLEPQLPSERTQPFN